MLLAQEALGHLELAELHEAEVPEGHRDVHVCHLQCEDQDQCSVRCQRSGVLQLIKIKISVQCAPCVVCNDLPECLEMILNVFLCEVLRDPTHEDLVYSFISVRVLEV